MITNKLITKELIDFANHLADISENVILKYYRLPNGEMQKEDQTPVTKADQEIEWIIREKIIQTYPDHGIIGEEYANYNETAEYKWIIDPIDGTSSFIVGRPIFGTLIALTKNDKPLLGIVNQPITKERWLGIDGIGVTLNEAPIKSRNCTKIEDAVMATSSPYFFKDKDKEILDKLSTKTKYQRIGGVIFGGDCYSYACLASGFIDIVIDPGLKIFDFAALLPILKMSGAIVSDWQGNEIKLESGIKMIACSSKELHQEVIKIINN